MKKLILKDKKSLYTDNNLKNALKLHKEGLFNQAEEIYGKLKNNNPKDIYITYLLGLLYSQTQRPNNAIENIEKYLIKYPSDSNAISTLGLAYFDLGNFDKSNSLFKKALNEIKGSHSLYYNYGQSCLKLKLYNEALNAYNNSIKLNDKFIEAYIGKANSLKELRHLDNAEKTIRHAIELDHSCADAHFYFGNILREQGKLIESIESYKNALDIRSNHIQSAINCGNSLKDLNLIEDAIYYYNLALNINLSHPEAKYNKSIALLLNEEFDEGWKLYDSRLVSTETISKFVHNYSDLKIKKWNGNSITGHLLVMGEQGIGDQIFYSSMLNDLLVFATKITVCIDHRLISLLKRSFITINFISFETIASSRVDYDEMVYLGSLGQYFRNNQISFNKVVNPYLCSDTTSSQKFRGLLKKQNRLLCGISWLSKNVDCGDSKSLSLNALKEVLSTPDIDFVDLQYGDTKDERYLFEMQTGKKIIKEQSVDNYYDIDNLAALISSCDLIISVSNSTAHLSGALGKPTIVLLPNFSAIFWYWHRGKIESKWYPNSIILRSNSDISWSTVLDQLKQIISGLVENEKK